MSVPPMYSCVPSGLVPHSSRYSILRWLVEFRRALGTKLISGTRRDMVMGVCLGCCWNGGVVRGWFSYSR